MRNDNRENLSQTEVRSYVAMMKETGITTIVAMNKYLTSRNLWGHCASLKTMNTYASGAKFIGVSREAYKEISALYKTGDVVTTHLVLQERVA